MFSTRWSVKSVTTVILASTALVVLASCGQHESIESSAGSRTAATAAPGETAAAVPSTTAPQAGAAGTTAMQVDTCGLLTKEEAKEILGGKVENMTGDKEHCRYVGESGMVMIDGMSGTNAAGLDRLILAQASGPAEGRGAAEPMEGVGDKAVLLTPPIPDSGHKSLWVLKGNVLLTITVNRGEATVTAGEMKDLGVKVVGRLP